MKITAELWKHQEDMVAYALSSFQKSDGSAYWYAGCRVGKTLASLKVAEELGAKRILVLTKKAAIRSAWQQDLDDFVVDVDYILLDTKVYINRSIIRGIKTAAQKATMIDEYINNVFQEKAVIVVVNYETARLIANTLTKLKFDLVMADESHSLKTHNSKQSKVLAKALVGVPHKLIMTGTGWDDRPTDVYGQARFLKPSGRGLASSEHFGNWTSFFDKYVDYYKVENIPFIKGYKNLDQMQEILNKFTLIVDSNKVLDLPEAHHKTILLDMPRKLRGVYDEFRRESILKLGDDVLIADNRLVLALRLHQLTSGYLPTSDKQVTEILPPSENPKLQALLGIIEELDGQPLVVFTRFTHDVALIAMSLLKLGIEHKFLTGRQHQHVEWQAGEGQVLIANIAAGGTGVNLNRARYCVYYSVGYSRTEYEQSLWRIRAQPDPSTPVSYWQFCMANSIDIDIYKALAAKGDVSQYLLRGLVNRIMT